MVNNSQYYILKLGGGKFTLNDNSRHIQYPIVEHIQFTTPRGYAPKDLTSVNELRNIKYFNSAFIIDRNTKIHSINFPF